MLRVFVEVFVLLNAAGGILTFLGLRRRARKIAERMHRRHETEL